MQFRTPQFIDIEDKIFGPFTFKQFIYMLGGAFMAYLCFKLLPIIIGAPIGIGLAVVALLLAFYKVNNRPFITVLQAWFKYTLAAKLYIWHKTTPKKGESRPMVEKKTTQEASNLSDKHLKDVSWSLDVLDATNKQ
ncbi:MAG: PrgI family protein [Candidatus Pacebacteria bacterium]|nr:PrgI family protein [Candidatus Paceibacterota bacterium]MBP9852268.1 PrgI family protein [Candidatus Paceibacterota bacterium]